jgi:hypothetical protein
MTPDERSAVMAAAVWVILGILTAWLAHRTVRVMRGTHIVRERLRSETAPLFDQDHQDHQACPDDPGPPMIEMAVYLLETVPFGPPQPGEWCEPCALPSAVRQTFVGLHDEQVVARTDVVGCTECGLAHNENSLDTLDNRRAE